MANIMVFCAHNDDQIIGLGGAISKYSKEGKKVYVNIFSYGESSHLHLKRNVIVEQRVKESKKSDKVLGIYNTKYFGLKENNFHEGFKDKKLADKIKKMVKKISPEKVFIHSLDDPHPDHRAVYYIIKGILDEMGYPGEVYTYEVWNVISFRKKNNPKLVVDVTSTFSQKVRAFKMHESQQVSIWTLMWNVYLKALVNGFNNGVKYAEVFYRIK